MLFRSGHKDSSKGQRDKNKKGKAEPDKTVTDEVSPYRDLMVIIQSEAHQRYPENDDLYVKYVREQLLLRVVSDDEGTIQAMTGLLEGLAAPNNEKSRESVKLLAENAADNTIRRKAKEILKRQQNAGAPSAVREKELAECDRILADLQAQGRLPAEPKQEGSKPDKEHNQK